MADALVSFVLEQLATVIKEKIQQEVGLVAGVHKEIENLSNSFKAIQAVLNDAEQRQIKDELVKLWYEEFKEVAYDMSDVLDKWSTEILRSQMDGVDDNTTVIADKKKVFSSSFLCYLCSCFNQKKSELVLRHDIGSRIQEITGKLELIDNNKNRFHLNQTKREEDAPKRIETSSVVDIFEISGRDTDKKAIVSKLLGECSSSNGNHEMDLIYNPIIISIVGMGGLGKTTLGQLVFNDDRVKNHFDKTMWVCVSDPFDRIAIAKAIIEETGMVVPSSFHWNALHHQLCESMKGKRFLLVLDDVWTYDKTMWDSLKLSFKYGAQGSHILITTRKEDIALKMNTTYVHRLSHLSEDDCWSLLSRIAFEGRTKEEYDSLKDIGTQIALKCKGLPLAAKTLGSLMHFKDDWQNILESEIWELEDDDNSGLQSAFLLSYYDLPPPLKGCFTYCAVFPKDHIINKVVLIKMWMAHDLLSIRGKRKESLEKIGEECFNKLVMRSFFQDINRDEKGVIVSCKMHDLVHDFALFLTNDECFTLDPNNKTNSLNYKTRHVTLFWDQEVEPSFSISEAKKLRTVIVLKNYSSWNFPYTQFKCLRVLKLNNRSWIEYLPNEINELIHLRYLDLAGNTELRELPDGMSNLYNLQSLNLSGCMNLHKLPRNMGRMINLRHLELHGTICLMSFPRGFGKLSCLRTLNKFGVGGVDGVSEGCQISELKHLNLIEGDLEIFGIRKVKTLEEACETELSKKHHLQTLHLEFKHIASDNLRGSELEHIQYGKLLLDPLLVDRMGDILEGLQPPPTLKKLKIFNFPGSKIASWMANASLFPHLVELHLSGFQCCTELRALGIFPHLVELHLRGFQCCTELPALGKLPSLKLLKLSHFYNVRKIGLEFLGIDGVCGNQVAFPKLEELSIFGMDNLEEFDLGVDGSVQEIVMPFLVKLSIQYCANLKRFSAPTKLPCLEELEMGGFDIMTHIGGEFFATGSSIGGANVNTVIFPKLKKLTLRSMENLEELELSIDEQAEDSLILIMPCIHSIHIILCSKLKVLPYHLSCTVRELSIWDCPALTWRTSTSSSPIFPAATLPLIEKLTLIEDAGVFSRSLSFFPNLKSLDIISPPSSMICPQGLSELQSLQYLTVDFCPFCMGIAKQVQHITSLQEFRFKGCDTRHPKQLRRMKYYIPHIFVDEEEICRELGPISPPSLLMKKRFIKLTRPRRCKFNSKRFS